MNMTHTQFSVESFFFPSEISLQFFVRFFFTGTCTCYFLCMADVGRSFHIFPVVVVGKFQDFDAIVKRERRPVTQEGEKFSSVGCTRWAPCKL